MADKQSREENQCIHCGKPYREENSKLSFIKVCSECKHYRVSEGVRFVRDKILERNMNYCKPLTPYQIDEVIGLYKEYDNLNKTGTEISKAGNLMSKSLIGIGIDCSAALKGLKALQREARETTKALRELEEQQSKVTGIISIEKQNKIMKRCRRCGGKEFEHQTQQTIEGKIVSVTTICAKCGETI